MERFNVLRNRLFDCATHSCSMEEYYFCGTCDVYDRKDNMELDMAGEDLNNSRKLWNYAKKHSLIDKLTTEERMFGQFHESSFSIPGDVWSYSLVRLSMMAIIEDRYDVMDAILDRLMTLPRDTYIHDEITRYLLLYATDAERLVRRALDAGWLIDCSYQVSRVTRKPIAYMAILYPYIAHHGDALYEIRLKWTNLEFLITVHPRPELALYHRIGQDSVKIQRIVQMLHPNEIAFSMGKAMTQRCHWLLLSREEVDRRKALLKQYQDTEKLINLLERGTVWAPLGEAQLVALRAVEPEVCW
jgi:hypothetical protein